MNRAEVAIPPEQCAERRKPTLLDRFWRAYWGVSMDDIVRCQRYDGHEEYGYDHEYPQY